MSSTHLPAWSLRVAKSVVSKFGKTATVTPKTEGAEPFDCLLVIRAPVDLVDENPAGFSLQGAQLTARGLWSDVGEIVEGDAITAQGLSYIAATVPRDNGYGLGDFSLAVAPE